MYYKNLVGSMKKRIVLMMFLALLPLLRVQAENEYQIQWRQITKAVNCRTDSDINADKVGILYPGERVLCIEYENSNWISVFPGYDWTYMYKDYSEVIEIIEQ